MGYTLNIESHIRVACTKLYGYVKDNVELESYQYLNKLNKIDEDTEIALRFRCFTKRIVLTKNEFKEFMDLYEKDMCNFITPYLLEIGHCGDWTWKKFNMSIIELIQSECDKMIFWG